LDHRRTIAVIGALAAVAAFSASAQSPKAYRIGLLETTSARANKVNLDALARGLREAGYREGQNLVIDYRSADGHPERFPELAAQLVSTKVDVIIARGSAATLAAKNAGSVPVVMTSSADPVAAGLVPKLGQPGGSVTGLSSIVSDIDGKRMEILRQVLPEAKSVAVLFNMSNPAYASQRRQVEHAANSLGVRPVFLDARNAEELRGAIASAVVQGANGLVDSGEAVSSANLRLVIELTAKYKLVAIYASREYTEAGGLMSYGVHYPDLYYRAASYVDRIFKGAKPGELPIEQPTKLEFVVNLKTAKALGLTIPKELLLRADQLIE